MSDPPWGKFQPSSQKSFKGTEEWQRRYHCDLCDENMMSDEALQLHRIWEQLKLLNAILTESTIQEVPPQHIPHKGSE